MAAATQQSDATTCQAHCLSIGGQYFSFAFGVVCFCKSSNSGSTAATGIVSGKTSCDQVSDATSSGMTERRVTF